MMWDETPAPDYGYMMRTSMTTAAELLESIERDIQESRQLIHAKNSDATTLSSMVASLRADNDLLVVNCKSLEEELAQLRIKAAKSEEALFADFEEKILACNGEIERVVAQCDEANREKEYFQAELKKTEELCTGFSEELSQAKLAVQSRTFQVQRLTLENDQLKGELSRCQDSLSAMRDAQQSTQLHLERALRQQEQLQEKLLLQQQEEEARHAFPAGHNLYADDDIAALLERVKALETENAVLQKRVDTAEHAPTPAPASAAHNVARALPAPKTVSFATSTEPAAMAETANQSATATEDEPATEPAAPEQQTVILRSSPGPSSPFAVKAGSAVTWSHRSPEHSRDPQQVQTFVNVAFPGPPRRSTTRPPSPPSALQSAPAPAPAVVPTSVPAPARVLPPLVGATAATVPASLPVPAPAPAHHEPQRYLDQDLPPLTQFPTLIAKPALDNSHQPESRRQLKSPESDSGGPFELEEDYVPAHVRRDSRYLVSNSAIIEDHYGGSEVQDGQSEEGYGVDERGGSGPVYMNHQTLGDYDDATDVLGADLRDAGQSRYSDVGTPYATTKTAPAAGHILPERALQDPYPSTSPAYRTSTRSREAEDGDTLERLPAAMAMHFAQPERTLSEMIARSPKSSQQTARSTGAPAGAGAALYRSPLAEHSYISDSSTDEAASAASDGSGADHNEGHRAQGNNNVYTPSFVHSAGSTAIATSIPQYPTFTAAPDSDYPDDFETESYDDSPLGALEADPADEDVKNLYYEAEDGQLRRKHSADEIEDLEDAPSTPRSESSSGSGGGGDGYADDGGEYQPSEEMDNVFLCDGSAVVACGEGLDLLGYNASALDMEFDPSIRLDELSRLSL